MIIFFSWRDFDKSVEYISKKCKYLIFSWIYGVPRGGICHAVALSHKLKVNLITKPAKNSLIVDDIYESGLTLNNYRDIEGAVFFVLASKKKPIWWNSVKLYREKDWIVFPWENRNTTLKDQREYEKKRYPN